MLVQIQIKMSEDNADKQNPGNSQRDACYFYFTQHNAKRNDQRQDKHGMCHSSTPKVGVSLKQVS